MKKLKYLFILLCLPFILYAPNTPKVKHDAFMNIEQLSRFLFWEGVKYHPEPEFTPELFYQYLVYFGVKNPGIVFRQTAHETGHFKSPLFLDHNNLFGMNEPRIRETTSLGSTTNGFARFSHWVDSVKDYILWQDYKGQWHDQTDYYEFLSSVGYAEDPDYERKVKNIPTTKYPFLI